jgi:predicted nuclease with TOPRIM domain
MLLKLLSILFALSLLSNALFYAIYKHERKTHFETMRSLTQCQAELKSTQENLIKYTQLYSELKSKCELDKKKIEQRYTALLKKASEPIPQVSIPPHTDECEALKEMLNEASKHFSP